MADGGEIPEGTPMWEPTDDVECFIPLDPELRTRSSALLADVARRLGGSDA